MTLVKDDAYEQSCNWLADLLPKTAHKHIDAILTEFAPEVLLAVDIEGARVPVEQVEVYGLVIDLDANGNAATVSFPYGAREVAE
jgi:hypothetical protein